MLRRREEGAGWDAHSHPHSRRRVWNQQLLRGWRFKELLRLLLCFFQLSPSASVGKWARAIRETGHLCILLDRSIVSAKEKDQQAAACPCPIRISDFIYYNCARVSGYFTDKEIFLNNGEIKTNWIETKSKTNIDWHQWIFGSKLRKKYEDLP